MVERAVLHCSDEFLFILFCLQSNPNTLRSKQNLADGNEHIDIDIDVHVHCGKESRTFSSNCIIVFVYSVFAIGVGEYEWDGVGRR